jgi:hypothetical protein
MISAPARALSTGAVSLTCQCSVPGVWGASDLHGGHAQPLSYPLAHRNVTTARPRAIVPVDHIKICSRTLAVGPAFCTIQASDHLAHFARPRPRRRPLRDRCRRPLGHWAPRRRPQFLYRRYRLDRCAARGSCRPRRSTFGSDQPNRSCYRGRTGNPDRRPRRYRHRPRFLGAESRRLRQGVHERTIRLCRSAGAARLSLAETPPIFAGRGVTG